MRSTPRGVTLYRSGKSHPRYIPEKLLLERLAKLPLGTLRLTGKWEWMPVGRQGRRTRFIEMTCVVCGITKWAILDNVKRGLSRNCTCQGKYGDRRAGILGRRYDAMVQRCERDTHISSKRYKGRGIKVLFRSREHFIRWALEKYPDADFKGLVFERIDNEGHYSPENLRLVTQAENLLNTSERMGRKRREYLISSTQVPATGSL